MLGCGWLDQVTASAGRVTDGIALYAHLEIADNVSITRINVYAWQGSGGGQVE
jgi:hypothetical protein